MAAERVLKTDLAVGLLHVLDALAAEMFDGVQVELAQSREDVRVQVLLHRQLEQQPPDSTAQRAQLDRKSVV